MTSDSTGATGAQSVLTVTPAARAAITEARAGEREPERLALFVEVGGVTDGAYAYDMWFQAVADAAGDDVVEHHGELAVVVVAGSRDRLRGATLDVEQGGLVMVNPNTPPVVRGPQDIPVSDLSSPIERAVLEVLEREVNPQIASHGGRADLVAVGEGGVAYLRLSGGCQGCGLASVTLSQGIATAIRDALPEIVDVVDVTAHAEGTNPYFAGAKK